MIDAAQHTTTSAKLAICGTNAECTIYNSNDMTPAVADILMRFNAGISAGMAMNAGVNSSRLTDKMRLNAGVPS